jgi:hypothetical protein
VITRHALLAEIGSYFLALSPQDYLDTHKFSTKDLFCNKQWCFDTNAKNTSDL